MVIIGRDGMGGKGHIKFNSVRGQRRRDVELEQELDWIFELWVGQMMDQVFGV